MMSWFCLIDPILHFTFSFDSEGCTFRISVMQVSRCALSLAHLKSLFCS
jgi:hypothetical protein